jgi:carboxyl-terminal processing protease
VTALPIVAIVDRTTAGASEIVAGAVLHHQRGDVVGERTVFGMGVEQELFPLEDGSALLLTTARYAAPSGKIFTVDGVTPNVEVKRTDLAEVAPGSPEGQEAAPAEEPGAPPVVVAPKLSDDTMLKKALEILQAKVRKG